MNFSFDLKIRVMKMIQYARDNQLDERINEIKQLEQVKNTCDQIVQYFDDFAFYAVNHHNPNHHLNSIPS
jgi:hypothetical protein